MIENRNLRLLFPSPLFYMYLTDSGIADRLEQTLIKMRADGIGKEFDSNGFFWQSNDNLYEMKEFYELNSVIYSEMNSILDTMQVVRDGFYINNMWANIAIPPHQHATHIHPNSYMSGLFYVRTPKSSANTLFEDPRGMGHHMLEPEYKQLNELNSSSELVAAEKNKLMFWPSWIPHGVQVQRIDDTFVQEEYDGMRMTVAFTIMLVGKNTLPTRKIIWK